MTEVKKLDEQEEISGGRWDLAGVEKVGGNTVIKLHGDDMGNSIVGSGLTPKATASILENLGPEKLNEISEKLRLQSATSQTYNTSAPHAYHDISITVTPGHTNKYILKWLLQKR
jgi:hypothetical protein